MEEYDRADAELYDHYSSGLPGDAEYYVEEAVTSGGPVLELGCGTGRILIPTAQAGIEIVGLDRSPSMLAVAERKVAELPDNVRARIALTEGNMAAFDIGRRFELVTIPYRAFLCLPTIEEQKAALRCARDHLAESGRLIINIFDPSLEIIQAHSDARGQTVQKMGEFIHPESGRRVIAWDTRHYDRTEQKLTAAFIFEELDDEGLVVSKRYVPLNLRWVYRFEMQHLLELCGLRVEALYGDFGRGEFRHGGEQIWVARRA